VPGTVWTLSEGSNLHHIAFWTDDLGTDSARLEGSSCPMEACMDAGGRRPVSFSYHRGLGIRVELVDRANEALLFADQPGSP
jgi:hypothetical protein